MDDLATAEIAQSYGAKVVQFHYRGMAKEAPMGDGHVSPRPRLDFLIDADEALTPELLVGGETRYPKSEL